MFKLLLSVVISFLFIVNVQASTTPVQKEWNLIVNPTISNLPGKDGNPVYVVDLIITSLTDNLTITHIVYNGGTCEGFLGNPKVNKMNQGDVTVFRVALFQNKSDCTPVKMDISTTQGEQTFIFDWRVS